MSDYGHRQRPLTGGGPMESTDPDDSVLPADRVSADIMAVS